MSAVNGPEDTAHSEAWRCECGSEDFSFSRTLCGCGAMHDHCDGCGRVVDDCPIIEGRLPSR